MVRVPVAAVGIVGDHHLRTVPPDQGTKRPVTSSRRLHKRLALLVTGPAGHARIVIAKLVHVGYAQQAAAWANSSWRISEALPVCGNLTRVEPQAWNLDLAAVPMRAGDDNRRMALLGGEASRPPVLLASSSGCTTMRVWVFLIMDASCASPAPSPARSHGSITRAVGGRRATHAGGVPSWRLCVVVVPPTCSIALEDRHGCGEQPSAAPCAASRAAGAVRGLPQRPRQGDRQRAQRRHGPKPLRPDAGVEHAGDQGQSSTGSPDADCARAPAPSLPGPVARSGRAAACRRDGAAQGGRPCSGCTRASASTSALCAITAQRSIPARAATTSAPAGVSPVTSAGPRTKNTSTSAATDSDQSTLTIAGLTPAARQRITAKASCMAWLPRTRAATSTSWRKRGGRAHPTSRRAHGRGGARGPQFRDPARSHGGRDQQQSLQSNIVEAPGTHGLPSQQGATNEGCGARPTHPAVLEPATAAAAQARPRPVPRHPPGW